MPHEVIQLSKFPDQGAYRNEIFQESKYNKDEILQRELEEL